jgi:hypothetical protein
MNERIKQLEPQCWEHNEFGLNFNYEKFAELILADVIAIIEDPKSYNRCVLTNFDASQALCVAVELVKEINQKLKDVK